MKLKKIELNQETLKNLTDKTHKKEEIGKAPTANPDCSFIISCPHPCVG